MSQGVNLDLSTWATRSCGQTIGIVAPSVAVHVLRREQDDNDRWISVGEARTGGTVDLYDAPRGWRDAAAKQQAFLRKEDAETRRIAYLYDDGRPPRFGDFSHQVFVPTPRPSDFESMSEDDDTEYDSAPTSIDGRSSSPESGGHDDMAFPRPRPRRDSTVRRERTRQDVESDSDEPGSVSSCSTASELDDCDSTDAAGKLADQLRHFRAVQQSMPDFRQGSKEDIFSAGKDLPTTTLRSGNVVKISLTPIDIALRPVALEDCSNIYVDFLHAVSFLQSNEADESSADLISCLTSYCLRRPPR